MGRQRKNEIESEPLEEGGVATLERANHEDAEARHADSMRADDDPPPVGRACIGLPVQYHTARETLPGTLQRQAITDGTWDVKVFLSGVAVPVLRVAVKFSEKPMPGCWSYLPGFGG